MCFVDVKQPITRLELPELYERLTTWATETTQELVKLKQLPATTKVPGWEFTKQEATEVVSHLDPDCALYAATIRDLLDTQLRYEVTHQTAGSGFIIDPVSGLIQRISEDFGTSMRRRLLTAWVIVTAVQLEHLLLFAKEAKEKNLRGRELLDFWASVDRQRR